MHPAEDAIMIRFEQAYDQGEIDALALLAELPRFACHRLQEQEFAWLEFRMLWARGDREQRLLDARVHLS
jgi:hypothetical protein